MGLQAFVIDAATVGSSEYFVAADSTTASPQTTDAWVEIWLDLSNLTAGDSFQIQPYEKVNGGTRLPSQPAAVVSGAQSSLYRVEMGVVGEGWELGVKKLAGTDRSIGWSIRQDTGASGGGGGGDATAANQATIIAALGVIDDFLDTEIAAIKSKTDNLPADPADASDIAAAFATVNSTLSTIAGFIDTEIASIKSTVESTASAVSALPTAAAIATAVLAGTIHTGWSLARAMRIVAGAVAGKRTGSTFRFVDDSGDAIVGTSDGDGNRTAATYGA